MQVEQLAMELHLPPIHQQKRSSLLFIIICLRKVNRISNRFQWLLKVLQQLYALGFRLISHEVNMTVSIFDLKEGKVKYL